MLSVGHFISDTCSARGLRKELTDCRQRTSEPNIHSGHISAGEKEELRLTRKNSNLVNYLLCFIHSISRPDVCPSTPERGARATRLCREGGGDLG